MKCTAAPNEYHLLVRPKFSVTLYDCQCNVTNIISGSLSYDLIQDILETDGLQEAKDAWWETYLWIKQQEVRQNEKLRKYYEQKKKINIERSD